MLPRQSVALFFYLADKKNLKQCQASLASPEWQQLVSHHPELCIQPVFGENMEDTYNRVTQYFAIDPQHAGIFITDVLEDVSEAPPSPHGWIKELIDSPENEGQRLVIVGITSEKRRPDGFDALLSPGFTLAPSQNSFISILEDRIEQLEYLSPPRKQAVERVRFPIVIRRIRNLKEYQEFLSLRYRVYRIMGYTPTVSPQTGKGMEIDFYDFTSIPIGAFETQPQCEDKLIGTARLIQMEPPEGQYGSWADESARKMRVRRSLFADGAPNQLPIFDSQRLNQPLAQAALGERSCAELSRVIVHPDYRGLGLSLRLTSFAKYEAFRRNISDLYLECLAIHQSLYEKSQFSRVPGIEGRVIGIGKTMIAMEVSLGVGPAVGMHDAVKSRNNHCMCKDSQRCGDQFTFFETDDCDHRGLV